MGVRATEFIYLLHGLFGLNETVSNRCDNDSSFSPVYQDWVRVCTFVGNVQTRT